MKKNVLAVALFAIISGSAFAHNGDPAPTSSLTAGVSGIAGVAATVGGSSSATLLGGSSQSGAQSLQTATLNVYSNTNVPGGNINGAQNATIGATGSTASQGFAYNLSTGAATGGASMTGTASQQASGSGSTQTVGSAGSPATGFPFPPGSGPCIIGCNPGSSPSNPYIPSGSVSGSESSSASQSITAGANQGMAVGSVSGGNFGADVGFTTNSGDVSVPTSGNTTTTISGNGVQLTAGAIGGTYSQTSTTNGVYQDGTNINFGGNSNQIATSAHSGAPVNTATGAFAAQSSINGAVSNGTTSNLPL